SRSTNPTSSFHLCFFFIYLCRNLGSCRLNGTIPEVFAPLSSLTSLYIPFLYYALLTSTSHLDVNQFHGNLPSTLSSSKLRFMYLVEFLCDVSSFTSSLFFL